MHVFVLIVTLATFVGTSIAQTPAERYRSAQKIWLSHRPDGMTFDDGSPEASSALDAMWTAVTDETSIYLVAHPSATPKQIEDDLKAIDPEVNPSFGPPLVATALRLKPDLFAISVTNYTASTVFVLATRAGTPEIWRLDRATKQLKDPGELLKAWRSDRASDGCHDKQKELYGTCGPLSGSIGLLPSEASGAPRFYIDAVYSKDAGALVMKQTSIWRWEGKDPKLLWIDNYDFSLDVDDGVHYQNGVLSVLAKRFPRTFQSCFSCFEPTTLLRVRIAPDSIHYLGKTSRAPQLDLIDNLFWRIAHNLPTASIAAPGVGSAIRKRVLEAMGPLRKADPKYFDVGMLQDWSVTPTHDGSIVCFVSDGLSRLDFTIRNGVDHHARITAVTSPNNKVGSCPSKIRDNQ